MNWTTEPPKFAEYYWTLPKNKDEWLDCSPEIVKVYFDGKRWEVFRPGMNQRATLECFTHWSTDPVAYPEGTEELLQKLYPEDYQ